MSWTDLLLFTLRIVILIIALRIFWFGRELRHYWTHKDQRRAVQGIDGVQLIVTKGWIRISNRLMLKSVGIVVVVLAGLIGPQSSRPEIDLSFILAATGFIVFELAIYDIVQTMVKVNRDAERYVRQHPRERMSDVGLSDTEQ